VSKFFLLFCLIYFFIEKGKGRVWITKLATTTYTLSSNSDRYNNQHKKGYALRGGDCNFMTHKQQYQREFNINYAKVAAEVRQIKQETIGLIHNQSRQRGDEVVD